MFKDPGSGAIAVHSMQNYATEAFLQSYTRFSARYGHPSKLYIDGGSQLVQAAKEMQISITDLTNTLNSKYQVGVEHNICPPLAHNQNGLAERSIKEVKKLFDQLFSHLKLDILSYETAFFFIANELNCLPISLAQNSKTENLEDLDIITPSRLLIGRNNKRALSGFARIDKPSRLMKQLDSVYESWWTVWLKQKLSNFIPRSKKWPRNVGSVKVGDIVVFLRLDRDQSFGTPIWKLGKVCSTHESKDGQVTQVTLTYKNPNEKVCRTVRRSV